eukprot:2763651-Pyramimonas_sp.AAC.1
MRPAGGVPRCSKEGAPRKPRKRGSLPGGAAAGPLARPLLGERAGRAAPQVTRRPRFEQSPSHSRLISLPARAGPWQKHAM